MKAKRKGHNAVGLENFMKEMGSNLRNLNRPSVSPAGEKKNEQRFGDMKV